MNISPIEIKGLWDKGWALDVHTISSRYIGEDSFGNPHYETKRSEIGEAIYELKYKADKDLAKEIAAAAVEFMSSYMTDFNLDVILPAPPTQSRIFQPVFAIAKEIARATNIFYLDDLLVKDAYVPAKNMTYEEKSTALFPIVCTKKAKRDCNILLIDDIYHTGTTLNSCVTALREDSRIKSIYVLTMTKTKGE